MGSQGSVSSLAWVAVPADRARWTPAAVWVTLTVLLGLVTVQALHNILDLGGPDHALYDTWFNIVAIEGAAVLCLARAVHVREERWAWACFGAAIASTGIGDLVWGLLYADDESTAIYSVCDLFWLAWYPLLIVGFALLIRGRVSRFEVHRWIDGLAISFIASAPFVAFVLQPVIDNSGVSGWAAAVTFSYPLFDMLLAGAAVGVFALLGWRRPLWALLITAALAIEVFADSLYAVQVVDGTYVESTYDFLWSGAVLLIALAAWRRPDSALDPPALYGWAAIALPLTSQLAAGVLGLYSHFHGLAESGLALSIALLTIAVFQMVVTRPRPRSRAGGVRPPPAQQS